MHPLDNVIWQALTTRHTQFAESHEDARRFVREVGPLGAFREHGPHGYESLAGLVGEGGTVGLFLDAPYADEPGWEFVVGAPLLQMVADIGVAEESQLDLNLEFIALGVKDSPEMIELTSLTKPGPFGTRTHELGTYLGVRKDRKLVCTHPEHTGRGYARVLMTEIMRGIRDRGETPFLHVRGDNARAIEIYKLLGFRERKLGHFAVLRKVQSYVERRTPSSARTKETPDEGSAAP
jgi:GNAT superfamily N-acetyltransferase